jgi:hypothetical protein
MASIVLNISLSAVAWRVGSRAFERPLLTVVDLRSAGWPHRIRTNHWWRQGGDIFAAVKATEVDVYPI